MATTARDIIQEIRDEAGERVPKESPYIYEQIILGGGPAGMTAAVYSARKKVDLLLLAQDLGGQVMWTSHVENYMGFRFIAGSELIEKFKSQVVQFPIDMATGYGAASMESDGENFLVTAENGKKYCAKSLIVATGKRSRPLGVPGEKELVGRGVTYCSICDGPFFEGMDIAVVGGGNSGFTAVVDMIKIANKVYSVINTKTAKADEVLIERAKASDKVEFFYNHKVNEVKGETEAESIVLEDRETGAIVEKPVSGVFVEIGLMPNSECAEGFLTLNPWKEIVVDAACCTSVEGVFAAGDVTNVPEKQIIVASGEGAKASLSAYNFLLRKKTTCSP